jgi:uncharacterized protein YdeI (YjbR/CyaY-like superfamily)
MTVTYTTVVIGFGKHASLHIPDEILERLGTNRRAPLKVTINGYTYRSTATAVNGECRVVFPQADREGAGVKAGDEVDVTLELEVGKREVELPVELQDALAAANLLEKFESLTYSKRREFARQVAEAKAAETKLKRVAKVLEALA